MLHLLAINHKNDQYDQGNLPTTVYIGKYFYLYNRDGGRLFCNLKLFSD